MDTSWNSVLCKKIGGKAQALLKSYERIELSKDLFFVKKNADIKGRTLLLIDDIFATGTTIKRCTEILLEESPRHIFVLTIATCDTSREAAFAFTNN